MNKLIPIKENSEDVVDISIREYFESKGWNTAFYSPPHGSWSILKLDLDGKIYETFIEGKGKRPDLIIYKLKGKKLSIIAFESKETVSKFDINIINSYYKEMNEFVENLINQKYRLVKIGNKLIENQKLPAELQIDYDIVFLCGTTDFEEDYTKFKNMLINKKGILVKTNWGTLITEFKTANINSNNLSLKESFTYNY